MGPAVSGSALIRFGSFELEMASGLLRKKGVLLRLAPQPFKVLALLASHPGKIVSREDIQHHLWNGDTFIDFERSLNVAIRQIRLVLNDSPDSPRFIETVPRYGYRFVAPVEAGTAAAESNTALAESNPVMPERSLSADQLHTRGWSHKLLLAVTAAVFILTGIYFGRRMSSAKTSVVREQQKATAVRRVSTGAYASQNDEANEYFEKAIGLARVQFDAPRIRQMLEKSLEADPHFAEARAWYGLMDAVMLNAGYSNDISWLNQAEHELQQALGDDPNSARAHSALAAVYFLEGRKDLVPMEAEKALSLNPKELDAMNWLCDYYVRSGEYAKARSVANQVLQMDPLLFPTRVNLAFSFEASGHPAKAQEQLQKVLELDPQNVPALTALAETYMNAGEMPRARKTLERVGSRDRDNYAVRLDWGRLLALEGKRTAALAKIDKDVLKYAAANSVDGTARLVAEFFATCGEPQKSLDWLELAVRNGDEERKWFERDPLLSAIRNQPRFERLMNSISLRQQESTRG